MWGDILPEGCTPATTADDGFSSASGVAQSSEAFAGEDEFDGDHAGFQPRSGRQYRALFARRGFRPLGSHLWLSPALGAQAAALETTG